MATDFTPTGTPLVSGMVDPQHPWVLWITRPDEKVEAYGYPPTEAGNNQLLADYRTAKQLGLPVQTRILPPETESLSFDAVRGLLREREILARSAAELAEFAGVRPRSIETAPASASLPRIRTWAGSTI